MRHIFLFFCLISCLLQSTVLWAQERFFETLYDVPIMTGLDEISEKAISFDKPDGRISQAAAVAVNLEKKQILTFYDKALGQMGWQNKGEGIYLREGERLAISIEKTQEKQGDLKLVTFLLKPDTK